MTCSTCSRLGPLRHTHRMRMHIQEPSSLLCPGPGSVNEEQEEEVLEAEDDSDDSEAADARRGVKEAGNSVDGVGGTQLATNTTPEIRGACP